MTNKTAPYKKEVVLNLSDGALGELQEYADNNDMTLEQAIESFMKRGVSSTKQAIRRRIRRAR